MKFTIVHLEISKLSHYIMFYEEKLQIFYSVTNSIKYINFWGALIDIFCRTSEAKHLPFVYRVTYRRIQLYNGLGEETNSQRISIMLHYFNENGIHYCLNF